MLQSELLQEYSVGKIVVASAGNEADAKKHFLCEFGENDSLLANVRIQPSASFPFNQAYLSFWGSPNSEFDIDFIITNVQTNIQSDLINISTNIEQIIDTTIACTFNDLTKFYKVVIQTAPLYPTNNKPYVHITVLGDEEQPNTDLLTFKIKSSNSSLHCWNNMGANFVNNSANVKTDNYYTIGSPGTVDEVVTVGAYVSKTYLYSSAGFINSYAEFSSRGPLTNGK